MRGTLTAGQTVTFAIPTIPTGSARTAKDIGGRAGESTSLVLETAQVPEPATLLLLR